MRRSIAVAAAGFALVIAMLVGPLGAAAAAPYVYGCTPLSYPQSPGAPQEFHTLSIYNGSASVAHLIVKILAGNGTNVSANLIGANPSYTADPTKTLTLGFATDAGMPSMVDATVPSSLRIVSDVPVSATDVVQLGDYHPTYCSPQQP
jgi:hypothetical protein